MVVYFTMFQAIFWRYIAYIWYVPPINRFLKWPLSIGGLNKHVATNPLSGRSQDQARQEPVKSNVCKIFQEKPLVN